MNKNKDGGMKKILEWHEINGRQEEGKKEVKRRKLPDRRVSVISHLIVNLFFFTTIDVLRFIAGWQRNEEITKDVATWSQWQKKATNRLSLY